MPSLLIFLALHRVTDLGDQKDKLNVISSISNFDEGCPELVRYTIAEPFIKIPVENTSKPNQGDRVNATDANSTWETQSSSVLELDNPSSRILMLNVTRSHASISPRSYSESRTVSVGLLYMVGWPPRYEYGLKSPLSIL
ncbi:hypothetical protein J0895_18875 [Phormidium pseudopriestleyi FRX01]|uniref:Uncharacterized protein n=1 Tax=Phormidium pseudopriestleyi FRX01 TaxID=1759528 RepID=A0ABS3FVF7_9CYAN|nr:hypothetical protein [Phormidium pseudopriestleyi]MBO0351097.1 hypothetical protein [Phormidium pseudopriestleyi FRX01]